MDKGDTILEMKTLENIGEYRLILDRTYNLRVLFYHNGNFFMTKVMHEYHTRLMEISMNKYYWSPSHKNQHFRPRKGEIFAVKHGNQSFYFSN